jgi:uncharacterized OsmC-like protein
MSNTIAGAIERLEHAVDRRPGFGVGTSVSVTTITDGLRCVTQERDFCTRSDLSRTLGGDGSAPTPGALVRAALGSCMAMSYRLRAAKHGIEIRSIRVTIEADSELAGMLSCNASAPPGYTEIRYHVDIESPAPADDVMRVVDEGDRLSPLLDVFTRANATRRSTTITSGAG